MFSSAHGSGGRRLRPATSTCRSSQRNPASGTGWPGTSGHLRCWPTCTGSPQERRRDFSPTPTILLDALRRELFSQTRLGLSDSPSGRRGSARGAMAGSPGGGSSGSLSSEPYASQGVTTSPSSTSTAPALSISSRARSLSPGSTSTPLTASVRTKTSKPSRSPSSTVALTQ